MSESRLELVIDSRAAERNLNRVEGGLNRVDRAGDRAQDSTRGMGRELGNLRTVALAAGGALAAMGVTSFSRDVFNTVSSVEKMRASLATVTGSVEGANAAWEQMREFAKTTPFELEQSVQGFIRMKSLGLDPTESAMRSFANTAAAMNTDLMQMVEAVADATVGEFERLREYGIRASQDGDRVSLTFQGVTTEIGNNAREIQQYLENIGNTNFADAAIDQMDTLGGKANNLGDSITDLYLSIGEAGATDLFNAALDGSADAVDYLNDNVETLATGVDLLGDAAIIAAGIFAGRLAGSLGTATLAKLAATRQAVLYQGALARMAGVSRTAAASQVALGTAARGAAGALALVGGPLGLLVGAGGLLYVFRDELNLTGQRAGLTEDQISDLRDEMQDMSQDDLSQSLSSLNSALDAATIKAATAREELAQLRSESRGSGSLGFGGGEVGAEVSGMQAVAEAQERILELDQQIALARGETASRIEQNANAFVVYGDKIEENTKLAKEFTDAQKEAQRQADQFASSLRSLEEQLFPLEAAQRQYRSEQMLLTTALTKGEIGIDRYLDAWGRLQDAQRSGENWQDAYGFTGDSANEVDKLSDSARDLGLTFESAFENAIVNGEGFRDVLDGIYQDILRIAVRKGISEPLGNAIAGAFGSYFGGTASYSGWAGSATFAEGGYTGPGGKYDPAGIVHAGEFVVKKSVVDNPGVRPFLENLNRKGYAEGGYVGGGSAGSSAAPPVNVYISTPQGTEARTEERQNAQGGRDLHVIIDEVTAQNMNNPGSRTGRALQQRFGAQRTLTGRG